MMGADPWLLAQLAVLLVAIGAVAGVVAGLLGVGGGIVLVPAFFFTFSALGYDSPHLMQICLATSLATIVFTSLKSVRSHHARGAVEWEILRTWSPWIAAGAFLGVIVVSGLRSEALLMVFGVLGLIVGLYMALGRAEWRLGSEMPKGVARGVTGSVIGVLSVLMGIGGGSFGVPLMTLHGVPIHRAVATASGFGMVIAVPSVIGFLFVQPESPPPLTLGAINLPAFLVVIGTTYLTTPLGVRLAHALNPKPLKRVFAAFIMLMALNMLRTAFGY